MCALKVKRKRNLLSFEDQLLNVSFQNEQKPELLSRWNYRYCIIIGPVLAGSLNVAASGPHLGFLWYILSVWFPCSLGLH